MNQIKEADQNALKREAYPYLPKDIQSIRGQKQILAMLSAAIAPVTVCRNKAEQEIWPKAEAGQLSMNQAVAQCAYESNKLIGMTILENLKLQQLDRKSLLQAWIALDYYCYVLKPEHSVHLHKAQDHISGILLHSGSSDIPGLPPIVLNPEPSMKEPVPVPAPVPKKKKAKTGPIIAAIALILAVVLVCAAVLNPVTKTEKAIDAIGEVTIDSEASIVAAEELYNDLTAEQQGKVENALTLTEARIDYDYLVNSIQKAADAIDAIGTVTLDSGEQIKKARAAYDTVKALGLEDQVAHKLSTLTRAEAAYEELYVQSLCDTAAQKQLDGSHQEALDAYNAILEEYPNSDAAQQAKTGVMDCTAALANEEIKAGNLENAMIMLTDIDDLCTHTESYTKAYETLQQKLKQLRPVNGRVFKNNLDWGWGEFTVSADSDSDAFVKLVSTTDPNKYVTFYVQAGCDATVKVKDGSYIVKYTTGEHWYGPDAMFGKDAAFTKADETFTFTTTTSGSYVYYSTISITLYSVVGGDMSTTPITADSF